jgi:hypothetical protein
MSLLKALEEERARLADEHDKLIAQRHELDTRIAEIAKELKAIDAYESARTGKQKVVQKRERTSRGDSLPSKILALLIQNSAGMNRAGLIEALGFSDDKRKQAAISPTLATLKKAGKINLTNGMYTTA